MPKINRSYSDPKTKSSTKYRFPPNRSLKDSDKKRKSDNPPERTTAMKNPQPPKSE